MANREHTVGITADGLVVIRSGPQAKELGISDPFAEWFATEDGRHLVQIAKKTDQVYEEFNLSRFKYTTLRLRSLATTFKQIIFLGSGFDCRSIWLDEFQQGRATAFEVDTPDKLEQKRRILEKYGAQIPGWIQFVPADLKNSRLPELLIERGFKSSVLTLIILEGVLFYLPHETSRNILNPKWLNLCPGSKVLFDFWSDWRVQTLNTRVKEKLGTELFHKFPFSSNPDHLKQEMIRLGYNQVEITSLEKLAQQYYQKTIQDEFPDSWLIVEATV